MLANRRPLDVTGSVRTDDPHAVAVACVDILNRQYRLSTDADFIAAAFADTRRLYYGEKPGWMPCDTPYHDLRHALDTALCSARLIDGHRRLAGDKGCLSAKQAALTVVLALLHDTGFIRRDPDEASCDGACFMADHEARSVAYAASYLEPTRFGAEIRYAQLIQATNLDPRALPASLLEEPAAALMARIIGTADLLAQLSDRYYLEKCRDFLYGEFVAAGLDWRTDASGQRSLVYRDGNDLLRQTPGFFERFSLPRLHDHFGGCHEYLSAHFAGPDPYLAAAQANMDRLRRLLATNALHELRRLPRSLPPSAQSKR